MTVPQITTTLTVPDSSAGRAAFVAAANQFGDDLTPYATEANTLATFVDGRATDAEAAAIDAQTAQGLAEDARDAAIAASTAIAADYNDAGVAYVENDLVWDGPNELYRCVLAYTSTAVRPSVDTIHWARVNATPDDINAIVDAAKDDLLSIPANAKSATYTLELADKGKSIDTTANVVIPANSAVAFPAGTTIMVTNTSGSSISISITTDTLRLAGTATTGTRTLARYGMATMRKVSATVWFISGAGLS